jgi:hypothetical protein
MANEVQEQIVREASDIEQRKVGLMDSAKALTDVANLNALSGRYLTPDYEVAGMSPDQLAALQMGRQGIGAYQPFLTAATRGVATGASTLADAQRLALASTVQPGFQQGIGTLYGAANASQQAAQLGAAPTAQAAQFQGPSNVSASAAGAGSVGALPQVTSRDVSTQGIAAASTNFSPQIREFLMGPAPQVSAGLQQSAPQMEAAQTGFQPSLQAFQMGPAERVSAQSIVSPGTMEQYMSPYQQAVTDISLREAQRQDDIARQGRNASAVRSGAFGGSRQAIVESEAARNLSQLKSDIQRKGLQEGYMSAQQQFNTEQQARLAAQQANQQAGLTVGAQNLGSQQATQQLGAQTGLQTSLANLSSEQQANVQNQAAQLQTQGMNAQQAMQAALANQQAGLTVGQQNLSSQLASQQLGVQTGLQTSLANLSNQQQANVQSEANRLQAQGMNQQAALQAAITNQQSTLSAGQTNAQLATQASIQNAANALQAQGMNQQTALQTALQNAQFRQQTSLANQALQGQYGLTQGQYGLQAAQQLANAGTGQISATAQQAGLQQNAANLYGTMATQQANIGMQNAALGQQAQAFGQQDSNFLFNLGSAQQRQVQSELDANRQNIQQQNMQPYQQAAFLSDIYKGAPSSQMSSMQQATAAPSPFQQAAGLGIAALGATGAARTAGVL